MSTWKHQAEKVLNSSGKMYHLSMSTWKHQAEKVLNFCHLAAIWFYAN